MDPNRGNDPNKSQKPDGNQPRNNYFTPLMIALALVLVFSWVMNMVESSQYTQTTYSDFLEAKAAGQLAEVLSTPRVGGRKDVKAVDENGDTVEYGVYDRSGFMVSRAGTSSAAAPPTRENSKISHWLE